MELKLLSAINLPPKYVRTRRGLRSMCTPSFNLARSMADGTSGRESVSLISTFLQLDDRYRRGRSLRGESSKRGRGDNRVGRELNYRSPDEYEATLRRFPGVTSPPEVSITEICY